MLFSRGVLQTSESIEETGGMVWQLVVVLAAGWFICALCLIKGIRTSGKVRARAKCTNLYTKYTKYYILNILIQYHVIQYLYICNIQRRKKLI